MERLTTDTPNSNFETLMNYAYAKNGRVALRYGDEENQDLFAYVAKMAKELNTCDESTEDILEGECMECVMCSDEPCILGLLCVIATQAAELRGRLRMYEDGELPERAALEYFHWQDADRKKPDTQEVKRYYETYKIWPEYIVRIHGSNITTALQYDGVNWFDPDNEVYPVDEWMPMPKVREQVKRGREEAIGHV